MDKFFVGEIAKAWNCLNDTWYLCEVRSEIHWDNIYDCATRYIYVFNFPGPLSDGTHEADEHHLKKLPPPDDVEEEDLGEIIIDGQTHVVYQELKLKPYVK